MSLGVVNYMSMRINLAIPNPGTADRGSVLTGNKRSGMDFERRETIIHALFVEFVGTALGFRLGRDNESVQIRTGCSGTVRILQFDDLIGGRVSVAHTLKFGVKTFTPFLKRAEKIGVGWVTPRLLGESSRSEGDDDVLFSVTVATGSLEDLLKKSAVAVVDGCERSAEDSDAFVGGHVTSVALLVYDTGPVPLHYRCNRYERCYYLSVHGGI